MKETPRFILKCILDEYPEIEEMAESIKLKLIKIEKECNEFLKENDITLPVNNEDKIKIFRSGKLKKIKNNLISTNKIKIPRENLNNKSFVNHIKKKTILILRRSKVK